MSMEEGFLGLGGVCMVLALVLGVVGLVIWIWALIDAIKNPALDDTMRIVWVLVIMFAQVIGAIIYLLVARSSRGSTKKVP